MVMSNEFVGPRPVKSCPEGRICPECGVRLLALGGHVDSSRCHVRVAKAAGLVDVGNYYKLLAQAGFKIRKIYRPAPHGLSSTSGITYWAPRNAYRVIMLLDSVLSRKQVLRALRYVREGGTRRARAVCAAVDLNDRNLIETILDAEATTKDRFVEAAASKKKERT